MVGVCYDVFVLLDGGEGVGQLVVLYYSVFFYVVCGVVGLYTFPGWRGSG
jgi:hypothetical protein